MKFPITKPLKTSHWMEETSYKTDEIKILDNNIEADVVIVGGGFVGLWTAITIKEQAPKTTVAIVEQDVCGIGVSRIGGRILASLALGINDEWATCALVNRKVRHFPPEPFRYLGGHLVRNAVIRKESKEMSGDKLYFIDTALAKLAPTVVKNK